jgi:carbon-monoxide dehydrogenase small subunit
MKTAVQFRHNGSDAAVFVDGGANLLQALREASAIRRRNTAADKAPAGSAQSDRREPHLSCLTLAEAVEGRSVQTADGLKNGPDLHPLQAAFAEHFAAQCGFCTPGMLMAAKALLDRNPQPTREEVVEAISGNICRCTGYEPIIAAIQSAAPRGQRRA